MLNTNIDWYEKLTAEQVWNEIDPNYDIDSDAIVFRSVTDENTVMISKPSGDDEWCCEIDGWEEYQGEKSWNMIGQGFGETAESALAAAIVDCVGIDVLREEGNCEDAVNVMAGNAYEMLHDGGYPNTDEDWTQYGRMQATSTAIVKKSCHNYGFEWEPYQICDAE